MKAASSAVTYWTEAWPVPRSSHWPSSLRQYTLARCLVSRPLLLLPMPADAGAPHGAKLRARLRWRTARCLREREHAAEREARRVRTMELSGAAEERSGRRTAPDACAGARGAARGELWALLLRIHTASLVLRRHRTLLFCAPGVCGMWGAGRSGRAGKAFYPACLLSDRSGGRDPNMVGLPSCLVLLTSFSLPAGPPNTVGDNTLAQAHLQQYLSLIYSPRRREQHATRCLGTRPPSAARARLVTLRAAAVGAQPVRDPRPRPESPAPRRCPRQTTPLR